MGGAHGNVPEVALGERERAVIGVEGGIALQHVEPLIRFLMDMRPRPTADRNIHGQERERPAVSTVVARKRNRLEWNRRSRADAALTTNTSPFTPLFTAQVTDDRARHCNSQLRCVQRTKPSRRRSS
jgi:hypothetical protein